MSTVRPTVLFPWRCPRCSRRMPLTYTLPVRSFTTSSLRPSTNAPTVSTSTATADSPAHPPHIQNAPSLGIKPESPRHFRIPQSLQPTIEKDAWVKGHLPKPRDIFSTRRGGLVRALPRRLERMYPVSQRKPGPTPPAHAELNAYRARMADMRRQNLREGLTALARRRSRRDDRSRAKAQRATEERRELLSAPPSDPDAFTRMSQTAELTAPLTHTGPYNLDANAAERQRAKQARYEAHATRKASETQEALHTLYMRARDFIVSEQQLDQEIDEAFGTAERPKTWTSEKGPAPSIWAKGSPPTLESMLQATGQASGGALSKEVVEARVRLQEKRLKRVAERLTGGKM